MYIDSEIVWIFVFSFPLFIYLNNTFKMFEWKNVGYMALCSIGFMWFGLVLYWALPNYVLIILGAIFIFFGLMFWLYLFEVEFVHNFAEWFSERFIKKNSQKNSRLGG